MSKIVVATVTTKIEMTVDILAQAFTELSDDEQAQFFVKAAAIADANYTEGFFKHAECNADWQWMAIGKHLVDCKCSTPRGREMVRTIHEAVVAEESRKKP